MCGIIGAFNRKKDVNEFVINQFENQHSRGTRGFGIIRIDPKGNIEIDRACETTKFLLDLYLKKSKMIIAHHRTPTSTENWVDQTHPIHIQNKQLKYDYYVIHNGVVSNDIELRQKHLELGFNYTTEYEEAESQYYRSGVRLKWNDSESIAIELALFIEGKVKAIGMDNSAAFIVLQVNKQTQLAVKVFFGKNGKMSDLRMSKRTGELAITSEGPEEDMEENKLFSFELKDPKMKLSSKNITFLKKEIPKEEPKKEEIKKDENPNATTAIGFTAKTEDKKPETVTPAVHRTWVENPNDAYDGIIAGEIIDKSYIGTTCMEFKNKIKDEDTTAISHIIDDALDEEMEKMAEIMSEYKQIIMADKLEKGEEDYYLEQVKNLFTTMNAITNIADAEYHQKKLVEDQEAKQDEIDWNKSYGIKPRAEDYSIDRF